MSKIALVNQNSGAGDIFFTQKIGYHFQSLGYRIIWPVIPQYAYIKDYMHNFEYPCIDDEFEGKDFYNNNNRHKAEIISDGDKLLVSLHAGNKTGIMQSKYEFVNIDWKDWIDYFTFERNIEKENDLYYNRLGLKDGEEYNLINVNFATPDINGQAIQIDIQVNNNFKNVQMQIYKDFSVFDWCKVMENSKEIHTVSTVFLYLFEKLRLNKPINIYQRDGRGFHQIEPVFTSKFNWVY